MMMVKAGKPDRPRSGITIWFSTFELEVCGDVQFRSKASGPGHRDGANRVPIAESIEGGAFVRSSDCNPQASVALQGLSCI